MCAVKSIGWRAFPSIRAVCGSTCVVSAGETGAFHGGILGRATLGVPGFGLDVSAIFHVTTDCRIQAMHKLRGYLVKPRPPCRTIEINTIPKVSV